MSNKSSVVPARRRTLGRLAAVGGTALILSSLVMTVAASAVSAAAPVPPIDELDNGTSNPALSGDVCKSGNFNFVVDMSGSIGVQDGRPSNLPDLKAGINGFVDAFESVPDTNGKYAASRFNGSSASDLTAGYVSAATFTPIITALSNPNGLTPTKAGIDSAAANNANPVAGAPKVMFVVTDGSPNVPPGSPLENAATWLTAANAAIAAANDARAAGYVVNAVYLSTAGDPGDTTLPFDDAGDAAWAKAVMTEIGGGSYFNADFKSFIDDLFKAIDCPLPVTDITTRASANVELGGEIWDVAVLSGGKEPTGTITFKLYGPNDPICDKDPVFTDEVDVDGNGDYPSGKFTPSAPGTYRWVATYSGDDGNAGAEGKCNDANESVTVTEPKEADIDAEKLVSRGDEQPSHSNSAQPGDVLDYQIIVKNTGNAAAEGVVVTDDIHGILAYVDYNDDCNGCTSANGMLTWKIDVPAGGSVTLTFSVTVETDLPDGTTTLENTTIVDGPGSPCPPRQGNEACRTFTKVSLYVLSIDKSNNAPLQPLELPDGTIANVPTANEGDTVTYTLKYNVGTNPVTGGVVTDTLPAGVEYVDGTASNDSQFSFDAYDSTTRTLSWTAESVESGGTLTYQVKIAAGANGLDQPLTNVATIDSEQSDPDESESDVFVPAEVGAETSNPTPPQTDAVGGNGESGPGASLPLILGVLGVLMLGMTFLTPAPAAIRRRNRR